MRYGIAGLALAGAFAMLSGARAAEPFTLTSPAYQDNALLGLKQAGNLKEIASCVAEAGNLSPPLSWANAPDAAKSFALTIVDPEGFGGAGFVHFVSYGIPATVTGFAEGELTKPSDKFVGGKNTRGAETYLGPCPPAGVGAHHYTFILMATDLDPKAPELKPGMTRDELLAALKGHVKSTAGLILRFKHP